MAAFSEKSRKQLDTVHPDLRLIHERVAGKYNFDHTILEGLRSDEDQLKYFLDGKSKIDPRDSEQHKTAKHLIKSDGWAHATDSAPYPIDFSNKEKAKARFYMFAGLMFAACAELISEGKIKHSIRWGGDWDGDKDFADQSFDDLPHFEIRPL